VEWWHSGSPRPVPKSSGVKNPLESSRLDFLIDYLLKSQTIKAEYYSSLLVLAIQGHSEEKRQRCRKVTKGVFFLYNVPAHRALETQKKLAFLGFQCLDHPPYSPDLAPSDYHLFPGQKKQLKCHHFSSDA
jgi:histone-lysine N-methyltransferase SETMAR